MFSSLFLYLVEASLCLVAFALAYRLFFCRLTHFQWNRWYLLSSLLLSVAIPFISIPSLFSGVQWESEAIGIDLNFNKLNFYAGRGDEASIVQESFSESVVPFVVIGYGFLILYLAGCLYKAWRLQQSLRFVYKIIKENPKDIQRTFTLIQSPQHLSAFSFLHYIFLPNNKELDEEELSQLLYHEQVHVNQKHTLDLLLFEIACVFFWFNPIIYYLRSQIRDVHEYMVDAVVSRATGNIKAYGKLLLKLASQQPNSSLMNTFSNKQIFYRIRMLTQTKSNPMQKFKFLFVVPVMALALLLCSFLEKDRTTEVKAGKAEVEVFSRAANDSTIRKISWLGNTVYTDAELSKALGIQEGGNYNKSALDQRLNYNPGGIDFASHYMDKGYLFFNVEVKEVPANEAIDLAITVHEGPQVKIGKIIIKGNTKISNEEILERIAIRPGELFNRSKVIKSIKAIAEMKQFNQETVQLNPIPDETARSGESGGIVDLEYVLEEI